MAQYRVRYSVKGRTTDELVTASVLCHDSMVLGVGQTHGCAAFVTRWFAPPEQLPAMVPTFNSLKMTLKQQWMSAWTAAMLNRTRRLYEGKTQAMLTPPTVPIRA
jgi:hypothetical protein